MDWTKIKLVSFDVDGTLYSLPRMKWCFTRLLLRRLLKDFRKTQIDLSRIRFFHKHMQAFRLHENPYQPSAYPDLKRIEEKVLADWYGTAIRDSGPKDDLILFLQELRKRGIPMVICSDYICGFKLRALAGWFF